jgi:hypothetical protein
LTYLYFFVQYDIGTFHESFKGGKKLSDKKPKLKGRIDDKFILMRLDQESGKLRGIKWWYTGDRGDANKIVAIWLGFKTVQRDKYQGPKEITLVDFQKPKVFPASNLTIMVPHREIVAELPYECYGTTGTGWSTEIFPGRVLHLEEGETTFGDIGFKLYQELKKLASQVNGFQAIVILENIILEGAKTSYHRPFDDTPKAKLSYAVYRQDN